MDPDLLSQAYLYGVAIERSYVVLQALIIDQTIIHGRRKVFTTGQARVNPEYYVIKCVGG